MESIGGMFMALHLLGIWLMIYQVSALIEGVEALAPPSAKRPQTKDALDKVPWKKVAEWMKDNKGCYHYGNATVKKKYQELLKGQQQQGVRGTGGSAY